MKYVLNYLIKIYNDYKKRRRLKNILKKIKKQDRYYIYD